jgi:hypothetical protein
MYDPGKTLVELRSASFAFGRLGGVGLLVALLLLVLLVLLLAFIVGVGDARSA